MEVSSGLNDKDQPPTLDRQTARYDENGKQITDENHVIEFLLSDKRRVLGVITFVFIISIILLIVSLTFVDSAAFTVISSILVAVSGLAMVLWVGNMLWIKYRD